MTNEQLIAIYNKANGIGNGKSPPISTAFIYAAMREVRKQALDDAIQACKAYRVINQVTGNPHPAQIVHLTVDFCISDIEALKGK